MTSRAGRHKPGIRIGRGGFCGARIIRIDVSLQRCSCTCSGHVINGSYTVQYTSIGDASGATGEESSGSRQCGGTTTATGSTVTVPIAELN